MDPERIDGVCPFQTRKGEDVRQRGPHLSKSGSQQVVLLYKAVRDVWDRDLDVGPQPIGDCVSWGFAGCVDLMACVEIAAGEAEAHAWEMRTETEAVYALSRVEYGDFDGSQEDGSYSSRGAAAVKQSGTHSRRVLGSRRRRNIE